MRGMCVQSPIGLSTSYQKEPRIDDVIETKQSACEATLQYRTSIKMFISHLSMLFWRNFY